MKATLLAAVGLAFQAWVSVLGGTWAPSQRQVSEVQVGLQSFVTRQAAAQGTALEAWSSYSFQYQGQSDGAEPVIFINASCKALPSSASVKFVMVFDGGACYFNVKYNPRKRVFYELMFNGEA